MMNKVLALFTFSLSAFVVTNYDTQQVLAQRQAPISKIAYASADNTTLEAHLIVPAQNLQRPGAGNLTPYEHHIAKMVEVTNHLCKKDLNLLRVHWQYETTNNTSKPMGTFNVYCSLARKIANEYGLSKPVRISLYRDDNLTEVHHVPTLSITGNKISAWRQLSKSFQQITDREKS